MDKHIRGDVEEAQRDWLRQQALWAMGYAQYLNGTKWCFGCDRPDDDCQCGHGARWLGPCPVCRTREQKEAVNR